MASEWPDQWSVDCVSKMSRTDRRTLFDGVPDPFRAGDSLREFPCRPIQEYLLLRSRGHLIGLHGILRATVKINHERHEVGGVSAFYLIPSARGKGWSAPFHQFTRERMRPWGISGVLGFCLPAVLPIYTRMGATEVEPIVFITRKDGTPVPSPQPLFWFPFREDLSYVWSLDVQGRRW